jgi:uncharacterized protein
MNLLETITPQSLGAFAWDHAPVSWQPLPGGGLRVVTQAQTDYFQDPQGAIINDAAPFLWLPVEGDFVAQAHVQPHHASTYDAGCLMVRHTATCWGKLCFEATDFGTKAAVSVVTNGISDDANGVNIEQPDLRLQIARAGKLFALHYALDGRSWKMVRYFSLPAPAAVRVGLVAQSPIGPGVTVDFLSFSLESRTLANIRAGV